MRPVDPGARDGGPVTETFDEVRPYLLTGGRTQARGHRVTMDTVIVLGVGDRPLPPSSASAVERRRIVMLARRPASVAEVSAVLGLPLAVTLVLVSDLLDEGVLASASTSTSQSDDINLLERLIAGVAAL